MRKAIGRLKELRISRSSFRVCTTRACVLAAAACAVVVPAAMAQFKQGDVYLGGLMIPGPGDSCGTAKVIRYTLPGWQATTVGLPGPSFSGRIAHDPFRDALVLGYSDSHMELMSSTGVRTPLAYAGSSNAQVFAPVGDGRIYFYGTASTQIRWYDSANVIHTVMNAAGNAPFTHTGSLGAMAYDAATNSIFLSNQVAGDLTRITKITLNPAGTQVVGAVATATFDASPGFNSEFGVGFSKGPGGKLFLAIDDNGGAEAARMQLIDPVTMACTPFATCNYNGVAAQIAGAYVPSLNQAVVYDTFGGHLRAYSQGSQGAGTVLPPVGLGSTCAFGAASQLIVIDSAAVCAGDVGTAGGLPGHDGQLDNNDFIVFINWFFQSDARSDRGVAGGLPGSDGQFDNNDFIAFINQFFAGC